MSRNSTTGLRRLLHRLIPGPTPIHHTSGRRSIQTVAFEEIKPSPNEPHQFTAFILHGLLGSGRNWRSFARTLSSSLSPAQWRLVLVDLRNHGKSAETPQLSPPHNLENAANDLADLVKSQNWDWPDVVIGHSLGGKVALQFAQSCCNGRFRGFVTMPKQVWVLDSVPGRVVPKESNEGEVERVLRTLRGLPSTIPSRKWLVDHMVELGFSDSLSYWIGSNLKKLGGGGETWAFNLDGAVQLFESYLEMDYWPLLENPPKGMEIDVVRAEKSDRWDEGVIRELERVEGKRSDGSEGKVEVHVLPNAGHWVHVDNPKGLLEIVAPRMATIV